MWLNRWEFRTERTEQELETWTVEKRVAWEVLDRDMPQADFEFAQMPGKLRWR